MPPTRSSRYSTSRQKACQSCSSAKARCDRRPITCGRCALRGLTCDYPGAESARDTDDTSLFSEAQMDYSVAPNDIAAVIDQDATQREEMANSTRPSVDLMTGNTPTCSFPTPEQSVSSTATRVNSGGKEAHALDFSNLALVCPINSDDIKNRWLNSYVPLPGQTVKEYPPSIIGFVYRILKSYTSIMVRGRGIPPFIHSTQIRTELITQPLSTSLSLLRIFEQMLPGSKQVAFDVIQREMNKLYEKHGTYNHVDLLAAFQAHLIYSMVLFFYLTPNVPAPFLRQAVINLQEIACVCSSRGLMCLSEEQLVRPTWESWIVAESKRRSLFTMYLFDSVLSAHDGFPVYVGTELKGLPAPSGKSLWQASVRHDWEKIYNVHLVDWGNGLFRIDELWPIAPDLDERGMIERRERVDRWLEAVDEYGSILYAVTSCTHGG